MPSDESVRESPSRDCGAVNSIFTSSYDGHDALQEKEKSPFFACTVADKLFAGSKRAADVILHPKKANVSSRVRKKAIVFLNT